MVAETPDRAEYIEILTAQLRTTRIALAKYGRHWQHCPAGEPRAKADCACGFKLTLSALGAD